MWGFNKASKQKADSRFVDLDDVHAAKIDPLARKALEDCAVQRATPAECADWLEGYLKAGGKADSISDLITENVDLFVARRSAHIPMLRGAARISIIVPAGVTLSTEAGNNHNQIYWMDGFAASNSYTMIYKDVARIMKKRGYTEKDIVKGLVATGKIQQPPPPPTTIKVFKPLKLSAKAP